MESVDIEAVVQKSVVTLCALVAMLYALHKYKAPLKTCICSIFLFALGSFLLIRKPEFETRYDAGVRTTVGPLDFGFIVIMAMVVGVVAMLHNSSPSFTLLGVNMIFVVTKIISPQAFYAGFSSDAVLATGVLCVFANAVYQSAVLDVLMAPLLPATATLMNARLQVMIMGCFLSSFLNNAPVMAILLPVTESFAERAGLPLRSLLMPLSFAIFLGGMNSEVGSSANLTMLAVGSKIVDGWGTPVFPKPEFFSLTLIGVPTSVAGMWFLSLFTRVLIKDKIAEDEPKNNKGDPEGQKLLRSAYEPDTREIAEMPGQPLVSPGNRYLVTFKAVAPMIGKTLQSVGLAGGLATDFALQEVFEAVEECSFDKTILKEEWANHALRPQDLLLFAATASGVAQLRRRRGLCIVSDSADGLGKGRRHRMLFEAVVGQNSPWTDSPVCTSQITKDLNYTAAVLGIRQQAMETQIGEPMSPTGYSSSSDNGKHAERFFAIKAGTLLLLEAHHSFSKTAPAKHIPMVSAVPGSRPPRFYTKMDQIRMGTTLGVLLSIILMSACKIMPLTIAGILAIFAAVFLEVISIEDAFKALPGPDLTIIACSAGLGEAILQSGVGDWLGDIFVAASFGSPLLLMAMFYLLTSVLGAFLNHNAVVVLVMPIAYSAATELPGDFGFRPFLYLVTYMASMSSFNIPVARAVNLMIVQRGPYRFEEFAILGISLQVFLMPVLLGLLYTFETFDLWTKASAYCSNFGNLC